MTVLRTVATAAVAYATVLGALHLAGGVPRHRAETAWIVAAVLSAMVAAARPAADTPSPTAANLRRDRWTSLAFLAGALLLYAPTIGAGFFSDDFVLLARAETGSLSMGNGFFRPLPMAIWAVLIAVAGHAPVAFHLVNVLLHGLNAWLVSLIARAIAIPSSWALAAGVLFLVHPVTVEAVTWVSALFDVASTSGTLLFLLGLLRDRRSWQWCGLAVAFLSKESGVAAPLIGLVLAYPVLPRIRAAAIALVAMGLAAGLRLWLVPVPEGYAEPPSRYVLKELVSRTFGTLAAPWSTADALWPAFLPIAATTVIGLLLALAIARDRASRSAALVTVAVLLSVLPVYRYFYVSPEMENARYLYMGAAFWAVALARLAAAADSPILWRRVTAVLLVVTVCGYVAAHLGRQGAWRAAGVLRDHFLADVTAQARAKGCGRVIVDGVPDSVRGVYIFRNGFTEAVQLAAGPLADDGPECSGTWDGQRITLDRRP